MLVYDERDLSFTYRPRLKVSELFYSLQGEGSHVGLPCSFVRLTGCALRCTYCDTEYAFYGGAWRDFDEILEWLRQQPTSLVQITGGEPLHQRAVWPLLDHLVDQGFKPLVETSGAVPIAGLHPQAHIVMDLKTPDSGEMDRNLWDNLNWLKPSDEIKLVVCSLDDLEWALTTVRQRALDRQFNVLISPESNSTEKDKMADKCLQSGLRIRFQVQLHKVIWKDAKGK